VLSALYDGEMANVDHHLDVLLDVLRHRGHLRRPTMVVVTSDHGEHLGEHGLADHFAALDDVLIRVPFIAWGPGIIRPGRARDTFEFVDVLPALARLLGQAVPEHLSERRDGLFEGRADQRRVAFAEWRSWTPEGLAKLRRRNPTFGFDGINRDLVCARDGRFKLVRTGDGSESLFDLVEDPSESRDVRDAFPAEATRLGGELDRAVRSWRAWEAAAGVTEGERREIERRLAELGYI
jgi:arylsulfatase A-like enzyme